MKNFWNSSIKKKLLPHEVIPALASFSNIHNPSSTGSDQESFFTTLITNPHLCLYQQEQPYLHSLPTPLPLPSFYHGDHNTLKLDHTNYSSNFFHFPSPVQLPSNYSSSYDSSWSLDYQPHQFDPNHQHNQILNNIEVAPNFNIGNDLMVPSMASLPGYDHENLSVVPAMLQFCDNIDGTSCVSMPVGQSDDHPPQELDSLANLSSCFGPFGAHGSYNPCDVQLLSNQLEFVDAIISSLPISSSSLSQSSASSSLSPLPNSQLFNYHEP